MNQVWLRLTRAAAVLALGSSPMCGQSSPVQVTAIRTWSYNELTRIVIETSGPCDFKIGQVHTPERLFLDLAPARPSLNQRRTTVGDPRLRQFRVAETVPQVTRVVFDLVNPVDYRVATLEVPDRIIVELQLKTKAAPPPVASARTANPPDLPVSREHPAPFHVAPMLSLDPETPGSTSNPLLRFVFPEEFPPREIEIVDAPPSLIPNPYRWPDPFPFDLPGIPALPADAIPPPTASARSVARPSENAHLSVSRALGLKIDRVVIDPGHGGTDNGAVGPHGLREKDVALDISLRLVDMARARLGVEVFLTRSDDILIPLQNRAVIANDNKADLFISIHANSSPYPAVAGTETYYLNLTASPLAMELAARENAGSSKTVSELQDLLRSITLSDKIEESSILAGDIEKAMGDQLVHANSRSRDRGVKRAPFAVLIGASMPSVLAEVGFLTNSRDEANLSKPEYRQKVAEALYRGIAQYNQSLSHLDPAGRASESKKSESNNPLPPQK